MSEALEGSARRELINLGAEYGIAHPALHSNLAFVAVCFCRAFIFPFSLYFQGV